jgi:hypothetical protein
MCNVTRGTDEVNRLSTTLERRPQRREGHMPRVERWTSSNIHAENIMRSIARVGIVLLGLICLVGSQILEVHAEGGTAYNDGQGHYFLDIQARMKPSDHLLTRLENRPGNAFWLIAPEANYWSMRVATDKYGATCEYNQVKFDTPDLETKREFLSMVLTAMTAGKVIDAYGTCGKNTIIATWINTFASYDELRTGPGL